VGSQVSHKIRESGKGREESSQVDNLFSDGTDDDGEVKIQASKGIGRW
jgi:hypothetical protein